MQTTFRKKDEPLAGGSVFSWPSDQNGRLPPGPPMARFEDAKYQVTMADYQHSNPEARARRFKDYSI